MTTSGADFNHYQGRSVGSSTPAERKRSLAEIITETRAREAAAEAERERISSEKHAALLENFREHIQNDDRYTAEEKADIIAQSFGW